jgi:heme/copper-type cytochrome/quinol oxidase subunit 4
MDLSIIILSAIITWSIGLLPPLLARYVILKRRFKIKSTTIAFVFVQYIFNLMFFTYMGSESKTHAVLYVIGFVSYSMLKPEKVKEKVPELY